MIQKNKGLVWVEQVPCTQCVRQGIRGLPEEGVRVDSLELQRRSLSGSGVDRLSPREESEIPSDLGKHQKAKVTEHTHD